jgi:porin
MSANAARFFSAAVVTGLVTASGIGQAPAPVVPADAQPAAACPQPACGECPAPAPPAMPPYAGPLCERPVITGDWWGHRSTLRDHGLTWNIYSTQFAQGVSSGGLDHGLTYGGRADYLLNVDGHKLGLWQGLFIDLHGETNYGQSANGFTGALMPVNTAALFPTTNTPVTALTGVKVTQALSESFVVFGGKINTLDGFDQPFTGGARGVSGFMNTALLAPIVALRTIPYSTFGAGFAVLKNLQPIVTVMVLDPNNTPTVSGFDTFFDRGVSIIGMANLPTKFLDRPGHQGVGFTYSNSKYTDLSDLPFYFAQQFLGQFPPLPQETGSWSFFYMFDQTVWIDPADPKRSFGFFGNLGLADGNPSPVRWAANIGLGGASPLRARPLDTFGAGYFYVGASDSLKNLAPRVLPLRDEHGVEAFYNMGLTPWCHLTSDIQVVTPVRDRVTASVVYAMRLKIDF